MPNCPHEVEFAERLRGVEDRSKSNTHRLEDMEKRQDDLDELVTSVALLAKDQNQLSKDVTEIKTDVKALTAKPGKRWDAVVEKIIMLVVGAVVAFVLAKVSL